jgi:hypothetical protein
LHRTITTTKGSVTYHATEVVLTHDALGSRRPTAELHHQLRIDVVVRFVERHSRGHRGVVGCLGVLATLAVAALGLLVV